MKMIDVKSLSLVSTFVILAACGDDLTDETYHGEPRFVVEGAIQSLDAVTEQAETYVGVYWINWARSGDTVSTQLAAVSDQNFPAQFTLALYDTPTVDDLNSFNDPNEGTVGYLGTGYVVVFDDLDGDGHADVEEDEDPDADPLRGFSPTHVVLYAQELNDAALAHFSDVGLILNPDELQPGYNLARFVCEPNPDEFDHLIVVPNEEITIEATAEAEQSDCLDFF